MTTGCSAIELTGMEGQRERQMHQALGNSVHLRKADQVSGDHIRPRISDPCVQPSHKTLHGAGKQGLREGRRSHSKGTHQHRKGTSKAKHTQKLCAASTGRDLLTAHAMNFDARASVYPSHTISSQHQKARVRIQPRSAVSPFLTQGTHGMSAKLTYRYSYT